MKRAVFVDRDGVLLDHGGCVISGVKKQLDRLKREGFELIMVTNQPDIATGKVKKDAVNRVNANLAKVLPIDEIYMCPHVEKDGCLCQKPKPGMLLEAAQRHEIDLTRSFMVGDRWRDIGAGASAGCVTILMGTGYGEPMKDKPDHRVADMETAVDLILESA